MKTNIIRIVCLLLAVFMSVSLFAACGDEGEATKATSSVASSAPAGSGSSTGSNSPTFELQEEIVEELTDADPYTIVSDATGKEIVILKKENGVITMTVAEKTTLKAFTECVAAKVNFKIVITDAQGNEITDENTEIANGMIFNVYEDGKEEAVVTLTIAVVSQEVIEETISKNEEIKQENEEMKEHNENQTPGKDEEDTSAPVVTGPKVAVTLASVWYDSYVGTSQSANTWQATFKNMDERKGYTTTVNRLDATSATDLIVKEVMAGKASADIFEVSLQMCRNIAKQKAACNWLDSKTLNFGDFQNGGTKAVTFTDKCYGVTLNGTSGVVAGVIYNKDLIKKYAPDYDLQKLYKENNWNFDAFREVAKLCTRDTNGDNKTDIYGVTSNTNIIGIMLTSNAGGTALMNSNGRVEATMCNDAGVAALEFCKILFKTDRSWKYVADIKTAASNFCTGTYAMFASNLYFYSLIAPTATFKFDFVHAPMGPDYGKYVDAVYDANVYVVPKTKADRLDELGTWMNHIKSMSNKMLDIESKNMAKNGFSQEAITIYKWCKNNMQADFSTGAFTGAIAGQVDGSVTNASRSPAKVMASIKEAAQKELDDFYANMY